MKCQFKTELLKTIKQKCIITAVRLQMFLSPQSLEIDAYYVTSKVHAINAHTSILQ